MSLKIGVDIDGVWADFSNGWRDLYATWFGNRPGADEGWDIPLDETVFKDVDEFWAWTDAARLWENLEPYEGALGGLYQLARAGHEIVFITNRHENARLATTEWVKRHWPKGLRAPEINHVKNKSQIPVQLYIDDSPVVIKQLLDSNKLVYRMRRPWNKGAGGIAVDDWAQFVKAVEFLDSDFPKNAVQVLNPGDGPATEEAA